MPKSGRRQLIATGAWLPGFLLTTRTQAWNCSNKVFAGCTKNTLVKRWPKSRPAIAMPNREHKLKGPASGKTLIRYHRGSGERPKRNAPGRRRRRFEPGGRLA